VGGFRACASGLVRRNRFSSAAAQVDNLAGGEPGVAELETVIARHGELGEEIVAFRDRRSGVVRSSQLQLGPQARFSAEGAAGDAFQFFHVGAQGDVGGVAFLGRIDRFTGGFVFL
jgi:hypothetical protein